MSVTFTGPVYIDRGEGLETVDGRKLFTGPTTPIPMPIVMEAIRPQAGLGWFWPERHWYYFRAWDRDPFTRQPRVAYNYAPHDKLTASEAEDHYVFVRETYWEGDAYMWKWNGQQWERIR